MGRRNANTKVKKPFFKKWWFWVIIVLIVFAFIGTQGSEKETANGGKKVDTAETKKEKSKNTSKPAEEKKKPEKQFYSVGDTVEVGDATYTLNSVSLVEDRNEFADTEAPYVIAVNYTMKNNGKNDLPVGMDLSAYDSQDKKMDSYPLDNTMGAVAAGKAIDCVQHFGLNELGEVELQFAPAISLEKTADFKVNVQ